MTREEDSEVERLGLVMGYGETIRSSRRRMPIGNLATGC